MLTKHYMIHPQLISMVGVYDRNGKLCTLVRETTRLLIVDQSPLEILDESIKRIGYDLRGARKTAKRLLGGVQMCPVMVNPMHRLVLFPTKSPKHPDTTWLNPSHIKRTANLNGKTLVRFNNGSYQIFDARLGSINTKIQNAEQLENMTAPLLMNTICSFILDPAKRPSDNRCK